MFVFMTVRFLGQGIHELMRAGRGDVHDDPAQHGLSGAATEVAVDVNGDGSSKP
jgi:hypothetical protein